MASRTLAACRVTALAAVLLGACSGWNAPVPPPDAGVPWTQPGPEAAILPQGWDATTAALFHFSPQGSRLMPRAWFTALERADGPERFAAPESLSRYGLIYAADAGTRLNPDKLPIGFAIDPVPQPAESPGTGAWVGLTCAACHTNEVTYRGARLRVEGAPAHFDLDLMAADLDAAVQATQADPAKFARLAGHAGTTPEALRTPFAAYAAWSARHREVQRPANVSGFSRVDALGQSINAVAVLELDAPRALQDANRRAPAAPVSYPHLWLAPQLDFVQWAPVVGSPMARNTGEVIGVFGRAHYTAPGTPGRLQSSVLLQGLHDLENWVASLQPPRWPEDRLGPIDRAQWTAGRALFQAQCQSCHTMPPFRMTEARDSKDDRAYIRVSAVPQSVVGTDPVYLKQIADWTVETGPIADLFGGATRVPANAYFGGSVGAVIAEGAGALGAQAIALIDSGELRFCPGGFRQTVNANRKPIGKYEIPSPCIIPAGQRSAGPSPWAPPASNWAALRAGPLFGTWATGPFLHNGSVPTVYELLSPVEERRAVFWVGGRELDPLQLGFVSDEAPGLFRFDTALPGNSNQGHLYPPVPFTPEQRLAVIAFLKDPLRYDPAGLR